MKKAVVLFSLLLVFIFVNAQERDKIRGGMNFGLGFPNKGLGFNADFDIRYNIMDNVNVGILLNGGAVIKDVSSNSVTNIVTGTISVINSTLLTSDYYFNRGESNFAPFLGGGIGLYGVTSLYMQGNGSINYSSNSSPQPKEDLLPGGLLRAGFEASRFRLTLMYFIIPNSKVYNEQLVNIGSTANSYFNISLGFYIGGGKWKKAESK